MIIPISSDGQGFIFPFKMSACRVLLRHLLRVQHSLTSCRKSWRNGESTQLAIPKRIEGKALSMLERARAVVAFSWLLGILLNARRFAEDEAAGRHLNRFRASTLRTALDMQAQAQRNVRIANPARRWALSQWDDKTEER